MVLVMLAVSCACFVNVPTGHVCANSDDCWSSQLVVVVDDVNLANIEQVVYLVVL